MNCISFINVCFNFFSFWYFATCFINTVLNELLFILLFVWLFVDNLRCLSWNSFLRFSNSWILNCFNCFFLSFDDNVRLINNLLFVFECVFVSNPSFVCDIGFLKRVKSKIKKNPKNSNILHSIDNSISKIEFGLDEIIIIYWIIIVNVINTYNVHIKYSINFWWFTIQSFNG